MDVSRKSQTQRDNVQGYPVPHYAGQSQRPLQDPKAMSGPRGESSQPLPPAREHDSDEVSDLASRSQSSRKATPKALPTPIVLDREDAGLLHWADATTVAVIAFCHPGKDEPCDLMCQSPFLSMFWEGDHGLNIKNTPFRCAEAAFTALMFWSKADELSSATGKHAKAVQNNIRAENAGDPLHTGYGDVWETMMKVLRQKFSSRTMGNALLSTKDAFLLEHSSTSREDECSWSDKSDGTGYNLRGLFLMQLREELLENYGLSSTKWKSAIKNVMLPNHEAGAGALPIVVEWWTRLVKGANEALRHDLGGGIRVGFGPPATSVPVPSLSPSAPPPDEPASNFSNESNVVKRICQRSGCDMITHDGQDGFCSKACREASSAAARGTNVQDEVRPDLLAAPSMPVQASQTMMPDPRLGQGKQVPIIAFYWPGHPDPCDQIYGHGVFGNFHPARVTLMEKSFENAEAAFQALKFWPYADRFAHVDGNGAFTLKKQFEVYGPVDRTYNGTGGNFQGMYKVLQSKFGVVDLRDILLRTGDAFLLEHNSVSGRDTVWSNNNIGDGANWLGMQLMLLRDDLNVDCGFTRTDKQTSWTEFITETCRISKKDGKARDPEQEQFWSAAVQEATKRVKHVLGEPSIPAMPASYVSAGKQESKGGRWASVFGAGGRGKAPMCDWCRKVPTFDGKPGYCSKTCRNAHRPAAGIPAASPAHGGASRLPMHPLCRRCGKATYDRKPGYCSITCRNDDGHGPVPGPPLGPPLCVRCGICPTWDRKPGGFCSQQCQSYSAHRAF